MAKRKPLTAALSKAARPRAVPEPVEAPEPKPPASLSEHRPGPKTLRPEGRAEDVLKSLTTRLPPEVIRQLRLLAVEMDKPIMYVIGEALNLVFEAHGKPPIAPERAPE